MLTLRSRDLFWRIRNSWYLRKLDFEVRVLAACVQSRLFLVIPVFVIRLRPELTAGIGGAKDVTAYVAPHDIAHFTSPSPIAVMTIQILSGILPNACLR